MRLDQRMVGLFWALSEMSEDELGRAVGIPPSLVEQMMVGLAVPSRDQLEGMAEIVGLTLEDAEMLLDLVDTRLSTAKRRPPS